MFVASIAPASAMPIEIGEDLELELAVLRRGLDDERRAAHGVAATCSSSMRPRIASRSLRLDGALLRPGGRGSSRSSHVPGPAPPRRRRSSSTGNPGCANTCAIPLPICPAPHYRDAIAHVSTTPRGVGAACDGDMPAPRACRAPRRMPPSGPHWPPVSPVRPRVDGAIVGRVELDAAHRRVKGDGEHPVPCDVCGGGRVHTAKRQANRAEEHAGERDDADRLHRHSGVAQMRRSRTTRS